MQGERIIVGMSGGVDSSVAAAVLRDQGFDVVGVTMLVWSPPGVEMNFTDSCCGLSAAEDARRVCARLGIPHYTLDLKDEFYEKIVRNYVDEYQQGRTPNPCVRCNEFIKFRALLDRALALGAEAVATGHYARTRWDAERRRWLLLRGVDRRKDQSYALYRLSQEQLARCRFPLGERTKAEVRALAALLNLPTAGKPDSQETCFVPDNDYPRLLQILAPGCLEPGEVRAPDGRVLGRHTGAAQFTLGQRRRLNVGSPVPLYVTAIDPARRVVTAAPAGHPDLCRTEVEADNVSLISLSPPEDRPLGPMPVTARIRYNTTDQPGALTLLPRGERGIGLRLQFEAPVRAPAPGQSLVCYRGDEVVGGGIITG
jgi:tRNA-uridine 2-sulfurtransferase